MPPRGTKDFDATGLLQSLVRGNSGMVLSFVYSGGNLTKVQSSDGRIVRLATPTTWSP